MAEPFPTRAQLILNQIRIMLQCIVRQRKNIRRIFFLSGCNVYCFHSGQSGCAQAVAYHNGANQTSGTLQSTTPCDALRDTVPVTRRPTSESTARNHDNVLTAMYSSHLQRSVRLPGLHPYKVQYKPPHDSDKARKYAKHIPAHCLISSNM